MKVRPPAEYYDQNDGANVCFLCESPRYELAHLVEHFGFPVEFRRCDCGLIKQTPMPNQQFFEWFFNSDLFFSAKQSSSDEIWGFYDYFKDEPSRLATSRHRYQKLRSVFERKTPLRIMKIGPSTGTMLHVAKQHGHEVLGCDVSSEFASYAKQQYNVNIDIGRFEHKGYPDSSFDVIMLFNVIENVPNQAEFLAAVHRALKPGGHFVVNFVDMNKNAVAALQREKYFLFRPPVCYAFTLGTISRVLDKFGFEVTETHRDYRHMHLEKMFTLLRWRWPHRIVKTLGIERIPFPIYAYPSRILVTEKRDLKR